MDRKSIGRNILLYQLYVICNEPLFWGPVVIWSLQNLARMSLPEIFFMESAVIMLCVLMDIPFGALADTIGRKKAIITGRLFLTGSIVCFATMTTPTDAWVGNILWAIGYTLQSGADTSFLYDTLKEGSRESEYKRIEGGAIGIRLLLAAFGSLSVGVLMEIDPRAPIYAGIPIMIVPLIAALFFSEPIKTEKYSVQKQFATLKAGCSAVIRSPHVRFMVLFAALLATISKVWFFTYNPYFEIVGLSIESYGLIFFFLNIVAWLSSQYAHVIEKCLGEKRTVIALIGCIAGPILAMGLIPIWQSAYLVIIQNIVRGFVRPFVGDYLHRHIASEVRSTVMSVQTSAAGLASVISLAGFGLLTGHFGVLHSLIILGVVALVLGAWSYRTYTNLT